MSDITSTSSSSPGHDIVKPVAPWYRQRVPVGFCLHMFFVFVLNSFPVPVWFLCLCLVWHEVTFLLLLGHRKSADDKLWLSRFVALAGLISSYIDWYLIIWQPDLTWRFALVRSITVFAAMFILHAAWKDIGSVLFFMLALTASTQVFACVPTDDFIAHISIVAASDSFQYFIGKRFGRYKPVPEISPNKTLEGYFGGLILCNIAGFLIGVDPFNPTYLIWYNGVLICGIIGDLSISTWKRFHMLKDTSNLLSSHGGVLDRLYSHIAGLLWTVIFMAVRSRPLRQGFGLLRHSRILLVTSAIWVAIWLRFIHIRTRFRRSSTTNLKQS